MRKFITEPNFEEVDLDDPKTYEYLPKDVESLHDLLYKEIGYYYCYVKYFHPSWHELQEKRCEKLIKYYSDNRKGHRTDILWLQEQIFIFQSETENMC